MRAVPRTATGNGSLRPGAGGRLTSLVAQRWPWRLAAAGVVVALAVAAGFAHRAWRDSPRHRAYAVPLPAAALPPAGDPASIARGRHLAAAIAVCTICHGDDLGGRLAFDHPLLGRGYTPNLTTGAGGIGADYGDADWVRALRHGVDRGGRGLLFMPVDHYRHLRDDDLAALVAYIRGLPPVHNTRTALELSLPARLMIDLGLSGPVVRAAVFDHAAPPPAPPADEGAYLVRIAGCTFCHGEDLRGGRGLEPGAPPGPDLGPGSAVARAGYGAFVAAMRAGRTTAGGAIDPKFMPWQGYARMSDGELQALWATLQGRGLRDDAATAPPREQPP